MNSNTFKMFQWFPCILPAWFPQTSDGWWARVLLEMLPSFGCQQGCSLCFCQLNLLVSIQFGNKCFINQVLCITHIPVGTCLCLCVLQIVIRFLLFCSSDPAQLFSPFANPNMEITDIQILITAKISSVIMFCFFFAFKYWKTPLGELHI